ncbi:MAG: ABC transporter ATP-binding protein, partial [Oscillospiraceae bacterium]|nr:ABC transporter ATP-binding protein [Oscillospiraceae bacterium]
MSDPKTNKKEAKKKPKYNVLQNVLWMMGNAWKSYKLTLIFPVLEAALAVSVSLVQLFIAPGILGKVEGGAPIAELLWTILLFSGLLFLALGAKAYVDVAKSCFLVGVRSKLMWDTNEKGLTMSYPLTMETRVTELAHKAFGTLNSNWSASEAIWNQMRDLLTNLGGFGIYLV